MKSKSNQVGSGMVITRLSKIELALIRMDREAANRKAWVEAARQRRLTSASANLH